MRKLEYWKYCLITVSLVLVSIQIQAQNIWTQKQNMITARLNATASVVNDKIYVIGGSTLSNWNVSNNEVYDPSTDNWEIKADMPTARGFLTSEVVNDTIYVIGGGYLSPTNKNEAYDHIMDNWSTKADMPDNRLGMRAGVVDGIIYIVGGNYDQGNCFAYNPATDTWTPKQSMPSGGGALSVTVYNGLIYTFGGSTYNNQIWAALPYVYAYNPQTDTWTQKQNMPTPRFALRTYLVNNKIYALGGSQGENTSLATIEVYDPETDSWDTQGDMPVQLSWFTSAVVDNLIYVIGGTTNWQNISGAVLVYAPPPVPVELTSFTGSANGKQITLNWSTATELNNLGFEIQRRTEGKDFFTVGFVNGHGTTTEPQNYSYADRKLDNGKYYYRLKQVDYDGSYEYSDVVEVDYRVFNSYLLEQNYPNPFNPTTIIGFGVQNKSNVKITVLNSIGEEVAVLLNEGREPGFYQVEFNAANLPSGVYFYQLRAGSFVETKKMLLLK
jgi:N-acetylneuraminic acid mutarotase